MRSFAVGSWICMSLLSGLLLSLLLQCQLVRGFVVVPSSSNQRYSHGAQLYEKKSNTEEVADPQVQNEKKSKKEINAKDEYDSMEMFPDAEYKEFSLLPHRPLGCTVEESLADSRYVFVTKIVEGGNADRAGVRVGDLLVEVTGLFGDKTPTIGLGVEKIKGMVSSRPEDEALEICVARGTDVLENHEKVVIEICSQESDDKAIEQCVVDYLAMDFSDLDSPQATVTTADGQEEECDPETDADCLVDNLFDMWAEDLPAPIPQPSSISDDKIKQPKQAVKPWSSRSSPSGTWVRDPETGEMKNIDS